MVYTDARMDWQSECKTLPKPKAGFKIPRKTPSELEAPSTLINEVKILSTPPNLNNNLKHFTKSFTTLPVNNEHYPDAVQILANVFWLTFPTLPTSS